jgi:hypothetical protein
MSPDFATMSEGRRSSVGVLSLGAQEDLHHTDLCGDTRKATCPGQEAKLALRTYLRADHTRDSAFARRGT